jgi:magnesium chelatase subunit I
MHAEIRTVKDPILRVKVVEEERLSTKTRCFGLKIMNLNNKSYVIKSFCSKLLPSDIDYALRVKISEVCSRLDVDGLRGDIVTNRAAKAYAAYNNRDKVTVRRYWANYNIMPTS